MSSFSASWQKHKSAWIFTVIGIIAIYVIVPQLGVLHSSWHLIEKADLPELPVALILTLLTYFFAAETYYFLAFRPIKYWQTVLMQLGAMFVNKLLPAGIGALGANYTYLKHKKHSSLQAASVVGVNNILGVLGHLICLIVVVAFSYKQIDLSNNSDKINTSHIVSILVLIATVLCIVWFVAKARVTKLLSGLWAQLVVYKSKPFNLLLALSASICLTLANVLCLYICANALGVEVRFAVIIIVFTLGVGAGTTIPTPGGLGGFEAGLFAGFVAYHVASAHALALVLLYRIISYWLPLLFGAPAFIVCQKMNLFSEPKSITSVSD
jgi:uncharacterized membrane protein YbhN (UPF0104 family)